MVICMEEVRVRVNENGRIVIPASIRSALGVHPGDEMILRLNDDELLITTVKNRIAKAQQLVSRYVKRGTSLSKELHAERREAAKRE
jgi:AbrB family looped-hinge helix DNA binding protein